MAYVALYRQWRPQSFSEVVGQDHISHTLKNAIKANRIVHAYLLAGPRGTGKTSTAKILAKSVNCLQPIEGEACNTCSNCTRINAGDFMDIVEIDAASNRGIDEIRDLREKVRYAPVEGKYKVYIIDEVHMLTNEAFNGLLKTLEEPPKHVIFILATTEPHKIISTVLSRCQKYDFKRISTGFILDRLEEIIQEEGLMVHKNAIHSIAKKAEGSMRDALSLLDQCLSFTEDEITEDIIATILGTVDQRFINDLVEALGKKDYAALIYMIDHLMDQGKDLRIFVHDLVEYFRNLVLVKLTPDSGEKLDLTENHLQELLKQKELFSMGELFNILEALSEGESQLKYSAQPRIMLELALIKAGGSIGYKDKVDGTIDSLTAPKTSMSPPLVEEDKKAPPKKKEVMLQPKKRKDPPKKVIDQGELEINSVKSKWPQVLELVRQANRSTQAYLIEGTPVAIKGSVIALLFKPDRRIHLEKVMEGANKTIIEQALLKVFQDKLTIKGMITETVPEEGEIISKVKELFGDVNLEIVE